jgi:hypothetical protein
MRITGPDSFRVLHIDSDFPVIRKADDANDLIGATWGESNISLIALPVDRLDPSFFQLSSLLAGDVLQKIVNYRLRIAIIGDISAHVARSDALRDFVWESNRGDQVWFLDDEAALDARIVGRSA